MCSSSILLLYVCCKFRHILNVVNFICIYVSPYIVVLNFMLQWTGLLLFKWTIGIDYVVMDKIAGFGKILEIVVTNDNDCVLTKRERHYQFETDQHKLEYLLSLRSLKLHKIFPSETARKSWKWLMASLALDNLCWLTI